MRQVADLADTFDAVINLWQSFGYFDEAANANILKQVRDKLPWKGRLILDIFHRGFFEEHQGVCHFERQGQSIVESKSMKDRRLTTRLEYGNGGAADIFEWELYTPEEMCERVEPLKMKPVVICAGYDEQKPATASSPRMQLVFEKVE